SRRPSGLLPVLVASSVTPPSSHRSHGLLPSAAFFSPVSRPFPRRRRAPPSEQLPQLPHLCPRAAPRVPPLATRRCRPRSSAFLAQTGSASMMAGSTSPAARGSTSTSPIDLHRRDPRAGKLHSPTNLSHPTRTASRGGGPPPRAQLLHPHRQKGGTCGCAVRQTAAWSTANDCMQFGRQKNHWRCGHCSSPASR
uniref:Uncharacterized protein n=1 Tax=Aegilops tauschii subsp. strangulata TaxID=200361 RepID=A0A453FGT0_AEGTS